eukprot:TRINITY_DN7158_c1_g4_i1.p1 TRINITY_DN7158_c1_g4~~TRINITY_DN7158_c1_g4_i1.p1  ORF type:complete len:481 (+),score=102.09 TRINITY_DN7158_c1_g4_i1:87-1529(+)
MAYAIAMLCPCLPDGPQLPAPPRLSTARRRSDAGRRRWPDARLCELAGVTLPAPPTMALLAKPAPPPPGSGLLAALGAAGDAAALLLLGWLPLADHLTLSMCCRRLRVVLWSQPAWQARLSVEFPSESAVLRHSAPGGLSVAFELHDFQETYRRLRGGPASPAADECGADGEGSDSLLHLLPSRPLLSPAPAAGSRRPWSSSSRGSCAARPPSARRSPSPHSRPPAAETPDLLSDPLGHRSEPEEEGIHASEEQDLRGLLARLGAIDEDIAALDRLGADMQRERSATDCALEQAAGGLLRRDAAREEAMRAVLAGSCAASALQRLCGHLRLHYECQHTDLDGAERWSVCCKKCGCAGLVRVSEHSPGRFSAAVAGLAPSELGPVQAPPPQRGAAGGGQRRAPPPPPPRRAAPHAAGETGAALRRTLPAAGRQQQPPGLPPALAATQGAERKSSFGSRPLPPLKAQRDALEAAQQRAAPCS